MKYHSKSFVMGCMLTGLIIAISVSLSLASGKDGSVMSRIKQAHAKISKSEQVESVIPVPKNIVQVKEPYQGGTFYTLSRGDEINRFKCSSCHNGSKVNITNAAAMSHADVKVNHGSKGRMLSCDTCHSKEDRNLLISGDNTQIEFDHVYNMCGQCHFRQKKDWVGGAHGKRVSFWAGERVVNNCTTCHNPHSPRFEKSWPATYSVPLK